MLKNCPIEFYNNCTQAMLQCHRCSAGNPRATALRYEPTVDLGQHPITVKPTSTELTPTKDIAKSVQVRKALKGERRQIDRVNRAVGHTAAQATKGSGRVNHDGDAAHLGFKVERKHRFNSGSVTVTKQELTKGALQGIDIFEIYLAQSGETHYVLTEAVYLEFIKHYAAQIERQD